MLKYFKYGLAGIFNNLAYTIIIILVGIFYSPQEAILMFKVDAVYGLCENFLSTVSKGRFYYKEKNSKGLSLLMLILLLSLGYFIFKYDFGYTMFVITLISSIYTVYTVDLAVYENKPILNLSVIYGVGLTLNVFVVLYFNIFSEFELWERLYFCYAFSGIIFDAIPNLIFLKYNPINIFKLKVFSFKWYKEEIINIYGSLVRLNQPILSSLCRLFIVNGLSNIRNHEGLVSLLISVDKITRVFQSVRLYILKGRTFALVDSDGKHMDVDDTFSMNKALLVFLIFQGIAISFLCWTRSIVYVIPVMIIRETFAFIMPCTNFHYFTEYLQYKKQGLVVAVVRVFCYLIQVLNVYIGNITLIYMLPIIDSLLYYTLVRVSYNIYCSRNNIIKQSYSIHEILYGKELISSKSGG